MVGQEAKGIDNQRIGIWLSQKSSKEDGPQVRPTQRQNEDGSTHRVLEQER
jgi:hypothetical protein